MKVKVEMEGKTGDPGAQALAGMEAACRKEQKESQVEKKPERARRTMERAGRLAPNQGPSAPMLAKRLLPRQRPKAESPRATCHTVQTIACSHRRPTWMNYKDKTKP